MKILEENSYYPFGMKHATYSNNDQPNYKYKYNGKEYQDELGLNLTAMDFRQYDNTLGRFNVIDPLAEQDYGITPYHFGYNNPVLFGDPSGLKAQAPEGTENNIVPGSVLAMFASGMNGLQVRDALEQQAWGPNFFVNIGGHGGGGGGGSSTGTDVVRYDGAGGVHLLTTNYQTGQSGYWDRRYVNSDIDSISIRKPGTYEIDITFKRNYVKYWVVNPEWNDANNMVNGLGIGLGVKQELWGIAIAQNYKSATTPYAFANLRKTQQVWRTANTLGKFGSKMLNATKFLGTVGGVIQVGMKGYEIYEKGDASLRDYFDLGVNTLGVIAPFICAGPAGWVIGAGALAYSIATAIYDANNP